MRPLLEGWVGFSPFNLTGAFSLAFRAILSAHLEHIVRPCWMVAPSHASLTGHMGRVMCERDFITAIKLSYALRAFVAGFLPAVFTVVLAFGVAFLAGAFLGFSASSGTVISAGGGGSWSPSGRMPTRPTR